jgi:membrane-associated phospholipid phosphatase
VTDSAVEEVVTVAADDSAARRWHRIRVGVFAAWVVIICAIVVTTGVPTGRRAIAMMTVSGLAISRLGQGWRRLGQVVVDWLPFTLVLMAYDTTRGVATSIGLPVHEADVVGWERALFGGHVPTVWLQQHLYDPHHVFWYDALFTVVYCTHFVATPIVAAVMWLRDRTAWLFYIARVVLLSVGGLVTYVLFPEAPPWMAARDGVIGDPIARLPARGFVWLDAPQLRDTLDHAFRAGGNEVAAMPSLHVGFACLIAIFVAGRVRRRWWPVLWLYPALMGVALVYLGEHYVIDLLAGLAYAAAAHYALSWWERRRAARRADCTAAETRAVSSTPA